MSKAFMCDYCHEFMLVDHGIGMPDIIPKARGKHDGGYVRYEMFVDGVRADTCATCLSKNLRLLADKFDELPS